MARVIVKLVESQAEWRAAFDLRLKVFVHEQGVPFEEELDEHDESATHVIALADGYVVGTGRVVFPTVVPSDDGHPPPEPDARSRIGRMAVDVAWRRRGVGRRILETLEAEARRRKMQEVVLHAQTYAKEFYASCGYLEEGPVFLEAGIDHVLMRKRL